MNLTKLFSLILFSMLITSCGGGGGGSDDTDSISSNWDEMIWDQGNWE